jgi:hypothetical protein
VDDDVDMADAISDPIKFAKDTIAVVDKLIADKVRKDLQLLVQLAPHAIMVEWSKRGN